MLAAQRPKLCVGSPGHQWQFRTVQFQDELIASWVSLGSARLFLDLHTLPAAAQKTSKENERRYGWALPNQLWICLLLEITIPLCCSFCCAVGHWKEIITRRHGKQCNERLWSLLFERRAANSTLPKGCTVWASQKPLWLQPVHKLGPQLQPLLSP